MGQASTQGLGVSSRGKNRPKGSRRHGSMVWELQILSRLSGGVQKDEGGELARGPWGRLSMSCSGVFAVHPGPQETAEKPQAETGHSQTC